MSAQTSWGLLRESAGGSNEMVTLRLFSGFVSAPQPLLRKSSFMLLKVVELLLELIYSKLATNGSLGAK